MNLVLYLLRGFDDCFQVAGVGGFSHTGFNLAAALVHHGKGFTGLILDAADGTGDFFACAPGALG